MTKVCPTKVRSFQRSAAEVRFTEVSVDNFRMLKIQATKIPFSLTILPNKLLNIHRFLIGLLSSLRW